MIRNIGILALILAGIVASPAAQLKEARVTEVVKDVKLLPSGAAPRPAAVSDEVRDGTAVRTGVESRSELKFPDQTLARLGANTVFSFSEGTRSLNLQDGAMLLRVPKGAGGAKISSSAVTAAITGTTVMVEAHPVTQKRKNSYYKFIVLEGTARLFLPGQLGESVLVKAGQMIIMPLGGAKKIPEAVDVNIQTIMQSSLLITGFGPLGSEQLIGFEQTRQSELKTSGQLYETNLMIAGGGTNVIVGDPNKVDVAVTAQKTEGSGPFSSPTPTPPPTPTPTVTPTPTITPSPTPSKFGTPTPITSPVPYVITSGTTITTDPSITTNGMTDYGKVYRGAPTDGPLSAFIFGSTSSFDTASNFDELHPGSGAGFKFTALQITGNPTISTANGEINLGLISVGNITSGAPGGTLTFAGIRGLLIATQNGSITLGPELSFSNLHDITFYARGTGSLLTLGSAISGVQQLELDAESNVQVNGMVAVEDLHSFAGGDFLAGTGSITATTSINIHADNDVNFNLNQFPEGTNTGQLVTIDAGHNVNIAPTGDQSVFNNASIITVTAANAINITGSSPLTLTLAGSVSSVGEVASFSGNTGFTVANGLSITADNSGTGNLTAGASILLATTGSLTVNNGGNLDITIANNDGGQIGTGGDILVTAAQNLTAGAINLFVNDRNGGSIGSGGDIGLITGGAFTAASDVTIVTSTRYDGTRGGTIGSDVSLTLTVGGASIGGAFTTIISTNGGGNITGSASNLVNVTGNLTVQGPILVSIEDTGFIQTNPVIFIADGRIGGDAIVDLNANSIKTSSTASGTPGLDLMALEASIYPNGSGVVGGNAMVNVFAQQDITAPGTSFFTVANGNFMNTGGGTIGGDAAINLSAGNFNTGSLYDDIYNYLGARIGNNASINLGLSGDLTVQGNTLFRILNYGGQIGESATIDIVAASMQAASLLAEIDNSQGGQIGDSAVINISVPGNSTITNDATLHILGSDGASSAAINFNGGNYNVGGTFLDSIDGSGTVTFNNATIAADTIKVGVFGSNGTLRIGGGTLSANTLLHIYAPGSNGIVDFISNVTLNSTGSVPVIAANTVIIENGVVVTIGGSSPANVFTNVPDYSARNGGNNGTTGTFAKAGATTQPLGGQPSFDSSSARLASKQIRSVRSRGGMNRTIHVTDSSQLGALLENASPARDGKVRIDSATVSRTASVANLPAQTSRVADARDRRRSADMNVGSKIVASRLP
jgi:mannose-6-phosphate isomerase-like protein (cupin superfamily)